MQSAAESTHVASLVHGEELESRLRGCADQAPNIPIVCDSAREREAESSQAVAREQQCMRHNASRSQATRTRGAQQEQAGSR